MNFKYVELNECEMKHYMNFLNEGRIRDYGKRALRKTQIEKALYYNTFSDLELDIKEGKLEGAYGVSFDEKSNKYICKEGSSIELVTNEKDELLNFLCFKDKEKPKVGNSILVKNEIRDSLCVREILGNNDEILGYEHYKFCCLTDMHYHIMEPNKCKKCEIISNIKNYKTYSLEELYNIQTKEIENKVSSYKINGGQKINQSNLFKYEEEFVATLSELDDLSDDLSDKIHKLMKTLIYMNKHVKNKEENPNKTNLKNYCIFTQTTKNLSETIYRYETYILDKFKNSDNEKYNEIYNKYSSIPQLREKQTKNDINKAALFLNITNDKNLDFNNIDDIIQSYDVNKQNNKSKFAQFLNNITGEDDVKSNKSMQEMALSFALFFNLENMNGDDGKINCQNNIMFKETKVYTTKVLELEGHKYEPDLYFEYGGKNFVIEIDGPCHKDYFTKVGDKSKYHPLQRKGSDVVRECILNANGYYVIHIDDLKECIGNFDNKHFNKEEILKRINSEPTKSKLDYIRQKIKNIVSTVCKGSNMYQSFLLYHSKTYDDFKLGGFKSVKEKEGDRTIYNLSIFTTDNNKLKQSIEK